ncbi:OprD family outer membrane porin [Pseudomonas sp. B392_1p]|uniref:OprD family outer membrane porin n=1 Tax=Pseudomonas sp. B392_1p TaxID=3457507 RepID=UPI003FCF2859
MGLSATRCRGHTLSAGYQKSSGDSDFAQLGQSSLAGKGASGASVYLITQRFINTFGRAGEKS